VTQSQYFNHPPMIIGERGCESLAGFESLMTLCEFEGRYWHSSAL